MKVNKVKHAIIAAFAAVFAFVAPAVAADIVLPNGIDTSSYQDDCTVFDGTTYHKTLQAAVEAVCGTAGATLYCKPGADVGSLQHAPVTATLTIYGNGAYVSGGSERDFDIGNTDPNGPGAGKVITADMTLTVKDLEGCGAWGNKATEHTVNLVFEDCQNMGKVWISGTTGTLNITIKDSSFEGVIKEAVYSNADGAITLTNVDFSNLNKAVNLNHKATGTQTVTLTNCSFTDCGVDVSADQIPVRVLSSVKGGKSTLTVSGCTFSGTPEGGADILLDYGVGVTEAAISDTAANVKPENKDGNAEMVAVVSGTPYEYSNVLPVAQIGTTIYKTLAAAVEAAQSGDTMSGDTIVLIENVELAETVTIPVDKTLTIDLNGKTVSHTDEANKYAINNLGNLTLKDSVGTGSVNARGIYNGYGNGADNVATAKIIIQSGTYNAKGTNGGAAIFNYGIAEINGGSFTSIGGYSLNNQAGSSMTIADGVTANNGIYCSNAKVTVNGGNISGNRSGCHVVYAWNAELTINGGTFYNNNSGNATIMSAGSTKCTITGGTFGIKDGRVEGNGNTWTSCLTDTANTATMTVTGGTFNGGFRVQAGTTMTIEGGSFNDVGGSGYGIYGTASVKGGTFTDATAKTFAANNLAEGYTLGENGAVVAPVAKIGDVYYTSLQAAINAAQAGDIVVVLPGEYGAIDISNKNITLQGTAGANGELLTVIKGGNPAITGHGFNGTIKDIKVVDAFKVMYAEPAGNVTVDNVSVTGATYGFHLIAYSTGLTWTIQNSYMDLRWANSFGVSGAGDAAIVIKGNEFASTNPYYPDYGAIPVNTFLPNITVEENVFGVNTKIKLAAAFTDTSKINISKNYHADGVDKAFAEDSAKAAIKSYCEDVELTKLVNCGTWGGIDWTLTADGTLTIAPTKGAPVPDKNAPTKRTYKVGEWRETVIYKSNGSASAIGGAPYDMNAVKKLVIKEGVTKIGSFTCQFPNCTGEVVIPSTVTYIGQEAFHKTPITSLKFAAGGTDPLCIANGAFKKILIEEVRFPADRSEIHLHHWIFGGCTNLKRAYIPSAITKTWGGEHVDYFDNFNSQTNPTWSNYGSAFTGCTAIEIIEFQSEEARDLFFTGNTQSTADDHIVASVGLIAYSSVQAAVNAAKESGAPVVLRNNTKSEDVEVDALVTIKTNGKKLNATIAPAEGLAVTKDESGNYSVVNAVAKIDTTGYATLQAAINAAQGMTGEVTISLVADTAEKVTVNETVGLYLTIDGKNGDAKFNSTGNITINPLSDENANRLITIQNIAFVNTADTAVDFISSVKTNHYPRIAVKNCSFTGNGKDTDVAVRAKTAYGMVIENCTATGLHSFLQNTAGKNIAITGVTVADSKGGFALGTVQGVTISGCNIDVDGYGIRMDANTYNNNAVIADNTVKAFIPVVVRNVNTASSITFNGNNTMNATNSDNLWCAIGATEYETNGTMPTTPSTGKVVVTLNDTGLNASGVYGNYGVAQIGTVKYQTLAAALSAAQDGDTVTLIWADGDDPIAMNGSVFGKSVTITGSATVDWSKGFLFVGRGGEGNGTVIFNNANLRSASNSASYGIHVSGREKNTNNKYDGTVVINNSTIELDYLIDKGVMTLDNSTLTVKNGFAVGGRPASETESGVDATATIGLSNGSKLVVNNHNGMGLGFEAIGVMNIDGTSSFECTQSFLVTANGTMNVNGGDLKVAGTLTNKGTVNVTDTDLVDMIVDGPVNAFGTVNISGTSKVAGILSAGYNGSPDKQVVVNITGNFESINVLVGSAHESKLNINDATAYFGQLGAFGDVEINNSTITYGYAFIRNDFTATNSSLAQTNGVNTYISGNAKVVLDNSQWTMGAYSNIGSYGGYMYGNADVALKNGSSITGTNLGVERSGDKIVKLSVDDTSAMNVANLKFAAGTEFTSAGNVTGAITAADGANVSITGGTYSQDVSAWCAGDFKCVANGDGTFGVVAKVYVVQVGDNKYETIAEAITAVADGGTITLIGNVTITEATRTHNSGSWCDGIYYVGDKSFTIDLGGFTVTHDGAVNDYLLNFKNDGAKANTITLKNGTIDAGTAAYCAICTSSASTQKITINTENINIVNNISNGSTVKIRGGAEFNANAGTKITGKNSYLGIECVASTVNIYDGAEIYMNGTSSYNGCLVGACGGGVVNVYGGYGKGMKGGFIAMTSGGTINVSGGEWIANNDGTVGDNSNLYVLTAQNNKNESGYVGASVINVTGGIFRGGMDAWVLNNANVEKAELNIAGGNFNANPTAYLDEGYVVNEVSGVYTVAKAVAKIGADYYTNLVDAFKAATSGCTIDILSDVTIDYKWDCRDYATGGSHSQFKEAVTINGNGHTLKFTGTVNDSNWNTIFRFEENATVNDLTVDISEATGAQRIITAKKSLTVDGLTIIGSAKYGVIFGEGASAADLAASEIVVKNSTLTGTRRAISDNEGGKDVKSVVITGNTLNANVYASASESITFNNNTAAGEVDLRSYTAENVLSVEAKDNTLNAGVKNYIYAKTIDAQADFTAERVPTTVSTYEQLIAALAENNAYVVLANDITATATQSSGYGKAGIVVEAGDVLDGNGKTLTINGANATWDCVIAMTGGEVKNLTIAGAMRGVFMPGANGDVVIDNCKFQNVIYTFNSDAGSKDYTVTIKNTELNGWTSFSDAHKAVVFDTCTFAKGNGYAYCRPYQATTFKDCSFSDDFAFDCSQVADNKLAFDGCTYNGQAITSENAFDLFGDGAKVLVNGAPADYTKVAQVGGQIYSDLQEAIKAAAPNGTVTLLKDVVVDEWKMVTEDYNIASDQLITLTMDGLTIDGNGKTLTVNDIESAGNGGYLFQGASNLTVSNLTINVAAGLVGGIGLKSGTVENVTFNGGKYAVLPGTGNVTVNGCTFNGITGTALYFEEDRDNLVVTGNTFNCADGAYAVTLRGAATFTDNTVVKGKVNLANSAKGEVSGNDLGSERFKVYNGATATITGNTINNLVFDNANVPQNSTFTGNTLSADAQAVLDAMNFVVRVYATYYASLQAALNAAVAGTGNVTVEILDDIDLTGTDWNPVTVSAPGYPFVTVNGNNKTIKGLNDMLFAGTWAGKSGLVINDLTIADSTIVHDENDQIGTVGVGAFVGYPSASQIVTLNNCCLTNSTVKGGHWTGGLVGAAGGWSGKDGPVFMNLTIQNCSVIDSTVTGKGSAGAVIGHAAVDAWTKVTIVDTVVTGNTISSTGSSNNKAGVVMGTIGVAGQPVTVNGVTNEGGTTVSVTESGNTATSNGKVITTIYGRQGSVGGELLLTGGTYANNPVETGVDYVLFPSDEYGVKQNADGTWGVNFKGNVKYVAEDGTTTYSDQLESKNTSREITLLADASIKQPTLGRTTFYLPNAEGEMVTLNLNGKNLVNNYEVMAKGILIITNGTVSGTGTIKPNKPEAFGEIAPTVVSDKGITVTTPDGAKRLEWNGMDVTTFVLATLGEGTEQQWFWDIRQAIEAATNSGKTLKLAVDIELDGAIAVASGSSLSIDLNGKTLKGKVDGGALIVNNGELELRNGTVDNDYNRTAADVENNNVLIRDNVTIGNVVDTAAVAKVASGTSEISCPTITDAIARAVAGDTVTLLKNVEISDLIKIEKAITLNLGGKSVTASSKKAFEVYADATIKNGSITAANRCVDTRKNVALTMENLKLTADKYTSYGNPQPLTIGGSENGTTVAMTGVEINAGDSGYGIITFVQTGIAATNSTVSGYSALYVKPGSDDSEFEFVNSDLTGTTGSNDVEGNSFSTIAIRANNVDVLVDADSTVTATGGYMYALSLGGTDAGEETVTGANVIIAGEIVGTNILAYTELADNVVCVKAVYANKLEAVDYVVEAVEGTDLVKVLGTKVAQVNGVNYASINAALAAAQAGDTVTIFAGTYNQALNVNKAITIVGERDAAGNNLVSFNGKLNVTANGATVKNINVNNGSNSAGYIGAKDVLIEGCSVVGGNGFRSCYTSGTVTFKDSTITGATYGIHFDGNAGGNIVIDNCVITGWTSFAATIKKVAVKDTTFAEGNYNYVRFYQKEVVIDGCTFNEKMAVDLAVPGAGVTVTGSTLENGNVEDLFEDVDIVKNDITVDGERLVRVAKIGNTYFETFGEAFAAAQAGDIITILAGDYTADLAVNKAITVVGETDADGKNLVNITGNVSVSSGATVKNINVRNDKTGEYACAMNVNGSNIVIDGVELTGYNGMKYCYAKGDVTIKNSTITGSNFAVHFDGSNGGNLTIENCDITGWVSYGGGIDQVTLKDSTFDAGSYAGQRSYADKLVIEDCEFEAGYKLDVAVNDSEILVSDSTMADGSSIVEVFNKEDIVSNDVTIDGTLVTYVAKIGNTYYATLEEALANVATWTTIKLVADATLDYGAREVYGRDDTTDIIIDGQGFTLTLNQTNSDWSSIGLKNADGKLTLKNMTIEKTGYGDTSGSWNTHAIIFSSNVEMNKVTVNNGIAVSNGATLKDVTINEANGYYGLWIEANEQTVTMNGGAINATNGGRGIKIADEYIDAPAKVTLNVTGTAFNTAKKAAVLVSSEAGADITASNVDITNVAEDPVNFAWVDDGWATHYGKVAVTGGTLTLEPGTTFVASLSTGDKLNGYYKTLADAVAAAQAGDTITLLADVTASEVIQLNKSLTINGAGHKVTSSASRVFRVTTGGVEVTLNDVNMVSTAERVGQNDVRGISVDIIDNAKLTLNNCSVDFTDASANDWAYAVNVTGGSNHTLTVNGGTYEGANVINVRGANNAVTVKDAELNSMYPNHDEYYGAGIWVQQNQGSSVVATGNTFNGSNAVAFNLGTGTALTESNNTDNTTRCVAKIGTQYYTSLEAAFAAAQDGDEVKILIAGTYALSTSGKNITITGAVDGVVFDNIGAHNMGGASMTFNNVTFDYYPNADYTGLQHSGNLVYNNCTINGQVFLYGDSETFNNCTFNQNSADAYNVWTYSADPVAFNNCTFNCAGKSVLIYKEGSDNIYDVAVNGCTFNASAPVSGKAAIEMDSSLTEGINLTITSSMANGFGNGNISGNSLWNNKKGQTNDDNNDITVVVNGTTVLAPVTFVAQIGDAKDAKKYASLQDAVNAAQNDETVKVIADIDLGASKVTVPAGKDVTLDLNGKVVSGVCNTGSGSMIDVKNTATLTVKDSSDASTGKITYAQGTSNVGWTVYAEGTLVLESGTLELTGSWSIGYAVDLRPNAWDTAYTTGSVFQMKGGKIVSSDGAVRVASTSHEGYAGVSASFIMEGGEIEAAWDGVFVQQSNDAYDILNVNISGGKIASAFAPIRFYGPVATSVVGGVELPMNLDISGGTFDYTGDEPISGTWLVDRVIKLGGGVDADKLMEKTSIEVTAGTFDGDVSAFCLDGYAAALMDDGRYTIAKLPESGLVDAGRGVEIAGEIAGVAVELAKPAAAATSAFGDYPADIYVTLSGLPAEGVYGTDEDFIVGDFGKFGQIVLSLEDVLLTNGMVIPVLATVGIDATYAEICADQGSFKCGITFGEDTTAACAGLGPKVFFEAGLVVDDETYHAIGEQLEYDLSAYGSVAVITDSNGVITSAGPYYTLTDALEDTFPGETVKLMMNVNEVVNIPPEFEGTLDLNDKTLNGSILAPNANLTVKNGKIVNTDTLVSAIEINAGTLNLENVNIDSARHALRIDGAVVATINGGTYKSGIGEGTGTYHALNVSGAAEVTINGGTFVGPEETTANSGAAVCVQSGSTVTIKGGNFSGGKNVTLLSGDTLKVEGGTYNQDPSAYLSAGYATYAAGTGFGVMKSIKLDIKVVDNKPVIGYAESDMVAGGTLILKATSTLDGTITWTTITWTKDSALNTADGAKDWVKPAEGYRFFTGGVAK